jgi:hypothetical protein
MDAAGLELLRKMAEGWTDAFGDQVTKGQRNALDLPAFYDFSEERYRFIENGSRVRDPDADSTRFTNGDEQFLIEPDAGDTLEFKTAEAPRYVVGNDAAVSWAFKFPTPLADATDSFTLFVEDAFEVEYDGAGDVTFRSLEDGSEKASTTVTPPSGIDSPSRPELEFNWYGVGRAEVTIDYTDENTQQKTTPARITVDDDWLSDSPVGRVGFRLDVTNPGIQLEAGSMAYIVKSASSPTGRPKPHLLSASELAQVPADGYGVLGALRIDPNRDNVFTTVVDFSISAEASVDTEVWLQAVPPSATDADFLDPDNDGTDEGPAYPRNNSPQNNVLQWTPNVSTFPTRTYAVDGSSIPNGRSVGAAVELAAGQGSGSSRTSRSFAQTRPIYPDDVVLIIGHTPNASTATDVDVFLATDQDW